MADIPHPYWTNCKLLSQFADYRYDWYTIKSTFMILSPKRDLPPIRATPPPTPIFFMHRESITVHASMIKAGGIFKELSDPWRMGHW